MNENDSEKLRGILEKEGYEREDDLSKCDLVVLNTCSVRENADDRFFGHLGDLKHLKDQRNSLVIAVCGCMMQQKVFVDKIRDKYKCVDIIFGTHNIDRFSKLLRDRLEHNQRVEEILSDTDNIVEGMPTAREYDFKAYVSITFGCDNFCSYCIVPYTRGREKSRRSENIIQEIKKLVADGCKEVMLLGQNVNSYGKKSNGECTFAELLQKISGIAGLKRIRFMTSHPKDLTDDVIEAIKSNKNICHSIHLPVQSGSDKILKLMNRHYDREQYITLVKKMRKEIPDITITTDIIVGFPQETEDDFRQTLDIVEQCEFDSAFTFIYSPRIGTKAAVMDGQIPEDVTKERFNRLLETLYNGMSENAAVYQDTVQEILVEGYSKSDNSILTGRTMNNKLVNFEGNAKPGDIVSVKITKAQTFYLSGTQL